MILEIAIGGISLFASVSVVASLRYAKWHAEREDARDPVTVRRHALVEKRRVIERERAEWLAATAKDQEQWQRRDDRIASANSALLALADEEAALVASDD